MNLIDWVIQIKTNSFSSQASLILYSRTLGTEQEQRLPSKIPQDRWVSQVDHPVFWGCCRWCSHVAEGAPWHLMSLHPLFGLTASATATLGIGMSEVTLERTGNILTSKNRGKSDSVQLIYTLIYIYMILVKQIFPCLIFALQDHLHGWLGITLTNC